MAYAPMDVRGPDQRRKQLASQVAQASIRPPRPLPPARGALGSALGMGGSAFGQMAHRMAPLAVTQPDNIMESILARLGITGRSGNAGEVSPGHGLAIPFTHPGVPNPGPPQGQPIPVQGMPASPAAGIVTGAAMPTPQAAAPQAGALGPVGHAIQSADMSIAANGGNLLGGGIGNLLGSGIPLGNGLIYDPLNDVVSGQSAMTAGARIRAL